MKRKRWTPEGGWTGWREAREATQRELRARIERARARAGSEEEAAGVGCAPRAPTREPAVGEVRNVGIEPLLDGPVFAPLRDRDEFVRVGVDQQTGTVAWPGGADLDPDVIYGAAPAARQPAARVTAPQAA